MSELLTRSSMREYQFAVIDPTVRDFLKEELITEILVPDCLTKSAHLMPALVHLQQLSSAQWNEFLTGLCEAYKGNQQSSITILIATQENPSELARHWKKLQIARPSPKRKVWLRLHDSRVLHQLLRILDSKQRRVLFGSAQAFSYWIANGWTTVVLDPDGTGRSASSVGPAGWDWTRIEQIGIVNRALYEAGIRDVHALAVQGALAEQLITRAQNHHGLSDKADVVEFTTRGLIYGATFDEHPRIGVAIAGSPESPGDSSLSDRFALITDEIWASFL